MAARVIASHYAEPVERSLVAATGLREAASDQSAIICQLECGEPFLMLDDTLGWAWGYAGKDRRVGYVPSGALGAL